MKLAHKTKTLIRSAALRAVRTFLQAALPLVVASGLGWVDVAVWQSSGLAGGAAVLAMVMRWLDETAVPTIPPG